MSIIYRVLKPNESEIYRNIRLESLKEFPEFFSANYEETVKTKKLILQFDIEEQTMERFVFGAFNDQNLIGISAFVLDRVGVGNIYQMYIQKKYQGVNIGSKLIENIIKEAKNRFGTQNLDICLEVSNKNLPAINLYKKAGFKAEKLIEKSNILIMALRNKE